MKRLLCFLLLALVPAGAFAFNTSDLLATIAMPLAVAAVADVAHVPGDQLANLVTTLNQANVPPTQFVEVIRYVPVALVDQNGQPFIAYVRQQTTAGVSGNALASAIAQHLQSSYGVQPQLAVITPEAAPAFVVSDNYIPTVVTRLAPADPLAAIGLPLAVAAVSNITGVSQDQLANLVATLNQANMPIVQEVQVIRYVPVALVDTNGQFVQFVQQQVSQGITGPALVPVITQELQTYYPAQVTVTASATQPAFVEQDFIPRVVVSRVEEVRTHPHGGPPGQLKKQLGLQTGAEVVHGQKPGRQFTPAPVATIPVQRREHGHGRGHDRGRDIPMASSAPPMAQPRVEREHGHRGEEHGRGHDKQVAAPPMVAAPPVMVAPPPGRGPAGGPPGQRKAKGGKGHGKD